MADTFYREPTNHGDNNNYHDYVMLQLRCGGRGGLTMELYDSGGSLYLSAGYAGIDDGVTKGTVERTAAGILSIAAISVGTWCKVEVSVSGSAVTYAVSDIAGAVNENILPTTVVAAYDYKKAGYYLAASKRIVGLAYKTAGGTLGRIANPNSGKSGFVFSDAQFYDLVIDSDADLALWVNAAGGIYPRVLIRAGTWTYSAASPANDIFVNLDTAYSGTRHVDAEIGSLLVFAANSVNYVAGIGSSLPSSTTSMMMRNVSVSISNVGGTSGCCGFLYCYNLYNCSSTVTATAGNQYGFDHCNYLHGCTGATAGTGGGGKYSAGFEHCNYLTDCLATSTASTAGSIVMAFRACIYLKGCTGTATMAGQAFGFSSCLSLTNCVGTGIGNSASNAAGFDACSQVVACAGQGTNAGAGAGYGFTSCSKMQQNKPSAASKTATYNASYADAGIVDACADAAVGGYNS